MGDMVRICYRGGEGEIVEKKSRFIATVRPVKNEDEAMAFVEEMRKKYWDARHNCYAYICGEKRPQMKCSDDGEPSQTAGRPMLDVLLGEGLCDVCVVVTRYFGGTLLGTGGLVRAYSQAVKEGLSASQLLEKQKGRILTVTSDYTAVGKLQYMAGQMGLWILDTVYTDQVVIKLLSEERQTEAAVKRIAQLTGGIAQVQEEGPVFYGVDGKELVFL